MTYIEQIMQLISGGEGDYTAVNKTDVISIGFLQWRANRALGLMLAINKLNPTELQNNLDGTTLYVELTSGNSNVWSNRYLNATEIAALKKALATTNSKKCQDELATTDIDGYISTAKSFGINEPSAIAYFCDLYNQSPRQASAIARQAQSNPTLDNLHKFAMQNNVMNKYSTRRKNAYEYCKNTIGTGGAEVPDTPPVNPPDKEITGTVNSINPRLVWDGVKIISYTDENPNGTIFIPVGNGTFVSL